MSNLFLKTFFFLCFIALFFTVKADFKSDTAAINKQLKFNDKILERNTDSAHAFIESVRAASFKMKYAFGCAKSDAQMMRYFTLKGKNDSAIVYITEGIKFARISKDTAMIINMYLISGRAYSSITQYDKALEFCLAAQRFADGLRSKKFKIKIAHDLGYIYSNMDLHPKAITYYKEGLKISQEEKDTFNFANISARLAGEFDLIKRFDSAMHYNLQSLKYFTLIHHKRGIGVSLVNLASNYKGLKMYDKAIQTTLEAIKIRTELGDSYAITILKNTLAACYVKKKEYQKALTVALEGEGLCKQQNDLVLSIDNYSQLYIIYYYLDDYKKAFNYAYKFINLKDSIYQTTNLASLTELQTKYETDKKEKEIQLLQLERKNAEAKSEADSIRRNLTLLSVSIIAVLIGIFSIVLYRRFKESNLQKTIIEKQKQLVDFKNKEIIDSINYAQTIQEALIPSEAELIKNTGNAFVIFKPKDIVSGDFYWQSTTKDYFFLAVADCTGHGVPGAFMSMMGISFLNEIVNEKEIFNTNEILTTLRERVINSLNKAEGKDKRDGMDMVVLRFDFKKNEVMFSGANNSIYHLSNNILNEIKGDKIPVGLYHDELKPYSFEKFKISKHDRIFATTDGLPDQFGGIKGKKFMYKKFETLLTESSNGNIASLKQKLNSEFENWKGNNEQIDDVTVVGIEI